MKVLITMRDALSDPQLLGHALPGPSWDSWKVLLIAAAGERLSAAERKVFRKLTGRDREPGRVMVELLLVVAGRRSGKSRAAAVFIVWLACCCDWTDCLALGERGIAMICCPTERQAAVMAEYVRAIIKNTPLLASLIENETAQAFTLKRQVSIEIVAANAKWVRGLTAIGIALDETAFLPSNEDSAQSDVSILEALRPSTATTGAPIIITSSPATTTGIVHEIWAKHYGPTGDPGVLVVQSDSRGLNPTLRQSVIDRAFETDARVAQREFGGEFVESLSSYISREVLERLVERGVTERKPLPGVAYHCFVDASSGTGTDSFAAAIGHVAAEGDRRVIVLDCVMAEKPPFDPLAITAALCGRLRTWGIREVLGDNYAGGFVQSAFAKHGVSYLPCPLNASELYIAALPSFTSASVALLDNPRIISELTSLRRKLGQAGKETVVHMRGAHDDLGNAIVGLIHKLTPRAAVAFDFGGIGVVTAADLRGLNPAANWTASTGYSETRAGWHRFDYSDW